MNDDFAHKVRSAAIAGWWTLLIASIFLFIQWLVYLVIMSYKPDWMLSFWGGVQQPSYTPSGTIANPYAITWDTVKFIWLWITGVFKMILWLLALVVIWLSLWARSLKRQ